MNEARLRTVLRAFDVWRGQDEYKTPGDDRARVRWSTTADGWRLETTGANWTFEAITMDECVELFAAKLREIAVSTVLAVRQRLAANTQALAILGDLLGVPVTT